MACVLTSFRSNLPVDTKIKSLACSEAELLLTELLHEVILDLLQPVQPVHDLQDILRPLEIVPNDSPYPKTWDLEKTQVSRMLLTKLLHEVVLDLLQHVQPVLDLQVNLRPLEMVPNDSPYPKTWG